MNLNKGFIKSALSFEGIKLSIDHEKSSLALPPFNN